MIALFFLLGLLCGAAATFFMMRQAVASRVNAPHVVVAPLPPAPAPKPASFCRHDFDQTDDGRRVCVDCGLVTDPEYLQ